MECIQLGREYGVGPWIKWGLSLLIRKGEELDFNQLRAGGLRIETTCALYSIREKVLYTAFKKKKTIAYSNIKGVGFGRYLTMDKLLKMVDEEVSFSQEFGALDDPDKGGLSLYALPTRSSSWHLQDGAGDDDESVPSF